MVFLEDEEKPEIPEKWFVCFDEFFMFILKNHKVPLSLVLTIGHLQHV